MQTLRKKIGTGIESEDKLQERINKYKNMFRERVYTSVERSKTVVTPQPATPLFTESCLSEAAHKDL